MIRLSARSNENSLPGACKGRANEFFSKMLPASWHRKALLADENQSLNAENARLGKTIEGLRGENRALAAEFNKASAENQRLKEEIARLEKTVEGLRGENRALAAEFNKASAEKQRLIGLQSAAPTALGSNAPSALPQGRKCNVPLRVPPPEAAFLDGMP